MAQYSVIGYYNTGFNQENIPDGPDILNLATKKTFNSIFHWQDRDLKYIEIQSDFNDICDVDYVQVGSSFYFVTNITMESETQCARLDLELDGLTTCGGIDGITILSGWMNRWSGESELFENTIEEPFSPTQDLIISDAVELNKDITQGTAYEDFVGSTVDLDDATKIADEYLNAAQDLKMLVPILPPTIEGTTVKMPIIMDNADYKNKIPNLTLYKFEDVKDNISSVRSLGMDSAITSCYRVPSLYIDTLVKGGISENAISEITSRTYSIHSGIDFKYGTYKHNKVYSGQFNKFILLSICSGERKEFRGDEIYDFDSEIEDQDAQFKIWADLSPEGCPFCRPTFYLRNSKDSFLECIKGEKWQNTPMVFTQGSGYYNEAYDTYLDQAFSVPSTIVSTVGSAITGGLYGTLTGQKNVIDMTREANQLQRKYETVAPEVKFPRSHSIQNFVGNSFYVYRIRLSDVDSELFDHFLTMYGEAISTDLDKNKLHLRQYFDYVECQNVNLEAGPGLRTRLTAQRQLENGVRIWHTLPNPNYYNNNPLIGG